MNRHEIHKRIEALGKQITLMLFLFIFMNTIFLFALSTAFVSPNYFSFILILSTIHMGVFSRCMDSIVKERTELEKMLKEIDHPEDITDENNKTP